MNAVELFPPHDFSEMQRKKSSEPPCWKRDDTSASRYKVSYPSDTTDKVTRDFELLERDNPMTGAGPYA